MDFQERRPTIQQWAFVSSTWWSVRLGGVWERHVGGRGEGFGVEVHAWESGGASLRGVQITDQMRMWRFSSPHFCTSFQVSNFVSEFVFVEECALTFWIFLEHQCFMTKIFSHFCDDLKIQHSAFTTSTFTAHFAFDNSFCAVVTDRDIVELIVSINWLDENIRYTSEELSAHDSPPPHEF